MALATGDTSSLQEHLATARQRLAEGAAGLAKDSLEAAAAIAPRRAETHYLLALAHHELGAAAVAERAARLAVELEPAHGAGCHFLGVLLSQRGEHAEAESWFREAVRHAPQAALHHMNLGATQLFLGKTDEARESLLRAAEIDLSIHNALYNLARITPMADGSENAARVMALLRAAEADIDARPPAIQAQVLYGLAKAHEDLGEPDAAFDYIMRGAAARRADPGVEVFEAHVSRIIQVFDAAFQARLAGQGAPSPRPVFIIGMPRSGTTLVEQILCAHPLVHGAGETPALLRLVASTRGKDGRGFPDWGSAFNGADCQALGSAYLQALPTGPGAKVRTTDKRLENVRFLGLIAAMLPNATLIHCRRDPRDVAFACLSLLFVGGHDWSYSMDDIARYWRAHERLMAHWEAILPPGRMLEVGYEALVADPEPWTRRIISHAGLEWDDACLAPQRASRPVTSSSMAQVREPIYSRAIGRWKPFARQLAPMFEAMGLDD
jgi:Tfp pilus assembly protein PilF